ncbi:alpha/beta hydrolase [Longimicrobium sp.]|uniref:alpha/beta fold hydrolase n=1 Tax=Longimicrobium sp. TaxID=2029185 RepID=UPI002E2EC9A1|nr:alpha/beta hydrolase [Longimicrobium sp.]HEX6040322.1 alpha/beta hydrolase [Longimicrobium sp.]
MGFRHRSVRRACAAGVSLLLLGCGTAGVPASAPAPADALPAGLREGPHDVVVNGVRLWYRVAGTAPVDAPPVVFLHGGPGQGSQSFAALAGPRLEPSLRMVYMDQRGSGRSERPWDGAYSIPLLVEDVEALRRELGVPRIGIIGQSFGGVLALEYAAKYPQHVSRMVIAAGLSDTPASLRAQCELLARTDTAAHARAVAAGGDGGCDPFQAYDGPAQGEFVARNMFPDATVRARLEAADTAGGLRNTGELGGAIFSQGLLSWRFSAHDRLTMPVLVIAGERDHQIGLEPQRDLARRLPDAALRVYEGGGHFMYLDAPERFARDITAFFAGDPPR